MNQAGRVEGNQLSWRVPGISGILEQLGLPEWTITTNGKSPSGDFYEGQYAEMGNVFSALKMMEDMGVDASTLTKLNPIGQALRTYAAFKRRAEGKKIRDARRGKISR